MKRFFRGKIVMSEGPFAPGELIKCIANPEGFVITVGKVYECRYCFFKAGQFGAPDSYYVCIKNDRDIDDYPDTLWFEGVK